MALPAVSPTDVAGYAPDAPTVAQSTIDQAADWVQGEIERVQLLVPGFVIPDPATRQGRELARAICTYALYLQAAGKASGSRVTGGSTGATKGITIGPIKFEKAVVDTEQAAAGMAVSAFEWLAATWRHLVSAGIPRPRLVAGASL
jgi:hypothetical protein